MFIHCCKLTALLVRLFIEREKIMSLKLINSPFSAIFSSRPSSSLILAAPHLDLPLGLQPGCSNLLAFLVNCIREKAAFVPSQSAPRTNIINLCGVAGHLFPSTLKISVNHNSFRFG